MRFDEVRKYVLFGGGELLCKVALFLVQKDVQLLVVTSDRHYHEALFSDESRNLGEFLNDNDIEHIVSKDVNDDKQLKKQITHHTVGLSFGAAWIFKKNFIDRFRGKLLNLHGSRLPMDRGGGGFSWRILRGDRTGVTLIHQIVPGVDTGDIVEYEDYLFPEDCRIPIDYHKISTEKYFLFIKKFLNRIENNDDFSTVGQPEYLGTYWPRLNTDKHAFINWANSVEEIERFICAFDDPYGGAITYLNNSQVRLKKAISTKADGSFHPFQRGIIYRVRDGIAMAAAKNGSLAICEVLNERGKNFVSKIKVGDRFYTPYEKIEEALQYRAIYTPEGLKN